MPKLYQQFEAVAFLNGPDGAKSTDDDVRIGRVQKAKWRTEEYFRTAEDDDVEFVGEIDQNGLFTPASDAPNPNRDRSESNEGDAWVWASYEEDGTSYEARAYLLVMPARFVFPAIR
jgi:quinohemoprotein amine dehydrogenase